MSEQKALPRPRQVTTAGVMGVVGSALLIFSLFDAVQRLRSVEMRAAVDEFLAEPPGNGLGVSTGWVLEVLHGVVLFNGALAAAAAVLAVYVFQRHQVARVGFSVAAALLLFTAPLSGGVMAMVVAFAATMLWSRPARDWFAGREPAPAPARSESQRPHPEAWPPPSASGDAPHWAPQESGPPPAWPAPEPPRQDVPEDLGRGGHAPAPAVYPFGSRPDPGWAPPAFDQSPGVPARAVGTAADRRPPLVTLAVVLTWVFAGGTALIFLLMVGMLMFAKQPLVDALQADPQFDALSMSTDDLLALLWVISAISIFWSVSAATLAALTFRRLGWARIGLVVSAAGAMLVCLMAFPVGLVHALAAGATLPMLLGGRAAAWFAGRPTQLPPPQQPEHQQPGQWQGPPHGPAQGPPEGPAQGPHQGPPPQGRQKPPVW